MTGGLIFQRDRVDVKISGFAVLGFLLTSMYWQLAVTYHHTYPVIFYLQFQPAPIFEPELTIH